MAISVKRGLKLCANGHDPFIEMASMPIYRKHIQILLSRNQKTVRLNLGLHWGFKVYQVRSNDDRSLTFEVFSARSNLRPYTFVWGKMLKNHFLKMC